MHATVKINGLGGCEDLFPRHRWSLVGTEAPGGVIEYRSRLKDRKGAMVGAVED